MTSYALISVSDKTQIVQVAQALVAKGVKILSTGGTYDCLAQAGINVETVESYTHFPEIMDGRVKTLHPKIHGGLLGKRDNPAHQQAASDHQIKAIDYVIVNLYPFKETIKQDGVTLDEAIEQIDIGGPSMLRSAAKNFQSVSVVTDPRDYDTFIQQLQDKGETSLAFRQYLAEKVFQLTANYDATIADYLSSRAKENEDTASDFTPHKWNHITLAYEEGEDLRYGENSHQEASFYKQVKAPTYSIAAAKQWHGKALSYNNIKDADAAIKIAREYSQAVAVGLKHMNPCGIGLGEDIEEAFDRCLRADPVSIFGGILVFNRPVTLALAEKLSKIFLEIIIAPSFDQEAFDLLSKKKNIRLLTLDFTQSDASYQKEVVSVTGGLLVQDEDQSSELQEGDVTQLPPAWTVVTKREPTLEELKAMNVGMKAVKHVKSNAIVITNDYMTLGIGAGQMNRVGSAKIALEQASQQEDADKTTYVMASDAFLPMVDTAQVAQEAGVTAIIQPGGSIRDQETIDYCNDHGIAMVMTGVRHFRH